MLPPRNAMSNVHLWLEWVIGSCALPCPLRSLSLPYCPSYKYQCYFVPLPIINHHPIFPPNILPQQLLLVLLHGINIEKYHVHVIGCNYALSTSTRASHWLSRRVVYWLSSAASSTMIRAGCWLSSTTLFAAMRVGHFLSNAPDTNFWSIFLYIFLQTFLTSTSLTELNLLNLIRNSGKITGAGLYEGHGYASLRLG